MQDQPKFILFLLGSSMLSFVILQSIFPIGGDIDLLLIHPFISESGSFTLRNNWYLAELNHRYVKDLLTAVYLIIFSAWLMSFKVSSLKTRRFEFGYLFWVSMLCTSTVGLLKSQSQHACPWNMTLPDQTGFFWDFSAYAGHCFPGGHASLGFALITGYFYYRQTNTSRARFYFTAGTILGFTMGWAQMMRGAHFLSHNLWSFWLCWFINAVIYASFYFKKKMQLFAVMPPNSNII
ncbi:phosphatase PAP2 family protein [Acinetobacter tianfuensis]|uniref:Phosphatase PAP2 family protein n=1 Tax=Acinetobacter tianfuensis TaxID=2419603 RepID=A0A3A8EI50_9GAMM|nr:phosphatase PAP2 family protein [Acinetobacter tianfuensis]RKG34617.1 phosphatase PAP2 family protein [Acinetobacter tianfuensis]